MVERPSQILTWVMVLRVWPTSLAIFIHAWVVCASVNLASANWHCGTLDSARELAVSQLLVPLPAVPLRLSNSASSRLVSPVSLLLWAITTAILKIVPLWYVYGTLQSRYTCLSNNCLTTSVLNDKRYCVLWSKWSPGAVSAAPLAICFR